MGSRKPSGARPVPRSWPGRGCSLPLPGDGADCFCPLPLQKGRSSRQNSIYSISGEKGECGAGGEAGMAKQRGKLGETGGHGTTGTAVPRPFFQQIRPRDIIRRYLGSQLCVREVTSLPPTPFIYFFLPFPSHGCTSGLLAGLYLQPVPLPEDTPRRVPEHFSARQNHPELVPCPPLCSSS